MKIYDNGKDIEKQDFIERGFLSALIDDAEQRLKDESWGGEFINLTDREYEELCDYDFTVRNVSDEALDKCVSTVGRFCREYLTEEQRQELQRLGRNEGIGFGIDLYQSLMYDPHIVGEEYREAVKKFPPIDATPTIGESVDGDIRVFFE